MSVYKLIPPNIWIQPWNHRETTEVKAGTGGAQKQWRRTLEKDLRHPGKVATSLIMTFGIG